MEFDGDEPPEDWIRFHNLIREYVVFLLLFISLYVSSYCLISVFKNNLDLIASTYEDAIVYRITLWMSTFSLTVSIGAALLLPISIISNEVLLYYPNSYYVQWLNTSLIHGLWNLVFLFSNIAIFILLPFAHLFMESEGFPGSKRGIRTRVYEALLVMLLVAMLVMGTTCIILAIFNYPDYNFGSIFSVKSYYLPFLYSCVSFIGVLMLLLCTPIGFARLFSVMSEYVIPKNDFSCYGNYDELVMRYEIEAEKYMKLPLKNTPENQRSSHLVRGDILNNSDAEDELALFDESELEILRPPSTVRRTVGYPFVMLLLLFLTSICVMMVIQNTLELCFGRKNLPNFSQNLSLGLQSLSTFGSVGAGLEIVLILYLWCTSIIGVYSLPVLCHLTPKRCSTSMAQVIGNCAVLLILSSALPVLARSLGITNFDLLGDFGRINWLGNFYVVLFQNLVFVVAAAICLGTKLTATVRQELYYRLRDITRAPFLRLKRFLSF